MNSTGKIYTPIQSSFGLLQLHGEDIHMLIQSSFVLLQLHGEDIHADTVVILAPRSEERRVGKECRSRWSPYH